MPADVSELLALSDDLKASGRKVRGEVVKVVKTTTDTVTEDMKAAAPVLTGALRGSITGTARGLTGTVGPSIRYWMFVCYGSVHNPNPVDFLNPPADKAQTTFPPEVEAAVIKAMGI